MAQTKAGRARRLKRFVVELPKPLRESIARLTKTGGDVLSKHKAKIEKKEVRHAREIATWQPGFFGYVPAMGKEQGPDYIGRFRVTDGSRSVREKAWLRRNPNPP